MAKTAFNTPMTRPLGDSKKVPPVASNTIGVGTPATVQPSAIRFDGTTRKVPNVGRGY